MLIWLCVVLLPLDQLEVRLETLAGQSVAGTLVEWSEDGLVVATEDGQTRLDLERLKALVVPGQQAGSLSEAPMAVELVDGSQVAAAAYAVQDGRATVRQVSGEDLSMPVDKVAWVRLQSETRATAGSWQELVSLERYSDLLVVGSGEAVDYHRGVVGKVTEEVVEFTLDGELLPVKRSKVYGVIYHQQGPEPLPDPVCSIQQTDGSRWSARVIRWSGEGVRWTTPAGVEVAAPVSSVAGIDFSLGKIVYLSDLEPESVQWTPWFGMGDLLPVVRPLFTLRRDRSLGTTPVQLEGREYSKALALHSRCRVVYRLPDGFRRFRATVGIDDQVRPGGHVLLTIRGDDAVLAEQVVRGVDPPAEVDVDIRGVRRLYFQVDFGDDLDVADHVVLAEARIVK